MAQEPPSFMEHQKADKFSGPAILEILLNSGLLGVLSVQIFCYHLAFPNDRAYIKCLVYAIYLLEFIQSVLVIEHGFQIFVTGFGDIGAIDQVGSTWSVPILTAIATSIVQVFYAHRISVLARSKKLPGVIIALSFIQLCGGIAVGVKAQQQKYVSLLTSSTAAASLGVLINFSQAHAQLYIDNASQIWNVGGVVCDIIIAVCMTYYLSQQCNTTIKSTKTILKKIIRLTVETGSLTAIIGMVDFALGILPYTYYYQTPMGIIGKVYATSMLVLINSRMFLASEETPSTSTLKFATIPTINQERTIEAHNRDVAGDADALAEASRGSEQYMV